MVNRYKLDAYDDLVCKEDGYLIYYEDYQALEAENQRLKETIMELKEMQRKQTLWIAAELGLNHADTEQIIKESIVATTMEMP